MLTFAMSQLVTKRWLLRSISSLELRQFAGKRECSFLLLLYTTFYCIHPLFAENVIAAVIRQTGGTLSGDVCHGSNMDGQQNGWHE